MREIETALPAKSPAGDGLSSSALLPTNDDMRLRRNLLVIFSMILVAETLMDMKLTKGNSIMCGPV